MKKFLSLLMMTLLCVSAWAADETVVFADQGYANGDAVESYTGTDFAIAFNKGTNSNAPKYYTTGSAIRVYGGNYFTVSSTTKTISKIELAFASGEGTNAITTDVETYTGGTWEGSANAVTFTVGGTSGHRRIASVAVTFAAGEAPAVSVPVITFSPEKAYEGEEVTATITCETEGASIMYALNDGEFQAYSEPLSLTETTTVHAKAVLNDPTTTAPVESAVTTKTITFGKGVQNIAEMNALPNGTEFKLMGNATVVYVNGGYLYIMDETGYSLIYGSTVDGIEAGNTIFNLVAKVSIYSGLFEVANATYDFDPTATEVEPNEYNLTDVTAEKMNEYIILKGVALSELSGKDFTMTDASGASLAGYQRFSGVEYPTDLEATYDVVGFGSVHNNDVQLYPISFTKTVIPEPVITVTPDFGEYETAQTVFVTVENMPEGAVVMYNFVEAEPTQGAPRKAEGDITWNEYDATKGILVEKSGLLTIAVNDANGEEITSIEGEYTITGGTTAVENINAGKAVAGVRYYNAAGQQAANAFQGVNIVVTTYSDGTQSVSKIVR